MSLKAAYISELDEVSEIDEPKVEELDRICTSELLTKEDIEEQNILPLSFTTLLENKEAVVDETVEFTCEMTQSGVEVVWLKNQEPLSVTEGRYEIINQDCSYQLVIPRVTTGDSGEYTVRAGALQSTAILVVNGS